MTFKEGGGGGNSGDWKRPNWEKGDCNWEGSLSSQMGLSSSCRGRNCWLGSKEDWMKGFSCQSRGGIALPTGVHKKKGGGGGGELEEGGLLALKPSISIFGKKKKGEKKKEKEERGRNPEG